jgi:nucleoside-diphosphate-sugar epimerase
MEPVQGDLKDAEALKRAAREADGVIHAAADRGTEFSAGDQAAVPVLLEALAGSDRPFIYTSAAWVMGDTRGRMNGEVSAIHPPEWMAWRPRVEEQVLASADRKVRSVVLRPGIAFGGGGGRLAHLFREARESGTVRVVGNGENHWSTVHVADLADLYVRVVAEAPRGELFLACAGMPQPMKRIAHAIAKAAGVEGQVEFIPVETARQSMGPVADCLAMDCKAGSTKAIRFFGWAPKTPYIFDEIERGSYGVMSGSAA